MRVEIVVAVIGALASVGAAYITATKAAATTAQGEARDAAKRAVTETTGPLVEKIEQLSVVTAGAVDKKGNVIRHAGKPFTVSPQEAGRYRINFRDPFPTVPVVVAISDGGDRGAAAEITGIDTTGFVVEGRDYSKHGLAVIGFQFVAVQTSK